MPKGLGSESRHRNPSPAVDLLKENKIVGNSCPVLVHVADGRMSRFPVARRLQPYKTPHWLPMVFNPTDSETTEKVTEKDVRESMRQAAREAEMG